MQACVDRGVFERPPRSDITYYGFVDPSGGSADSFALAIGHLDAGKQSVVVDCLRERRPPFSPEAVTEEFAVLLRSYHITNISGDRYAGIWPVEQFSRFGVNYEQSAKPKSDLYGGLLPLINSKRVELLDHAKLLAQLCALERRTARGGKDSIDHPPGGHDDLINAVAGLATIQHQFGGYTLEPFQPGFRNIDQAADAWQPLAATENLVEGLHAFVALHERPW